MSGWVVERVTDDRDLDALAGEWASLAASARTPSVFQTWEWVRTWWQVYGGGKELFVLAVRDRESRLRGLAPLYRVAKRRGPLRVRELRFLGFGEDVKPDYLGLVAADGDEADVADAVCGRLDEWAHEWDTACLTDMPGDGGGVERLAAFLRARGCLVAQSTSATCRYVTLPGSFEAYLRSLGKNQRYNVGRRTRALVDGKGAQLFGWEDPATVAEGIEALARLHRKRWSRTTGSGSFATPKYLAFHHAIARQFLELGRLRLYGLRVGGEVVGALYCYRYMGRVCYYQSGFDPDWYRHSPGLVLCAHALRRAIEEGAREFDFLRGDHEYKEAWASQTRTTERLYVARPTLASRMDYALTVGMSGARRRLRRSWRAVGA